MDTNGAVTLLNVLDILPNGLEFHRIQPITATATITHIHRDIIECR